MARRFSKTSSNGCDVTGKNYMATKAGGQARAAFHSTANPLTDRAGRPVPPLGGSASGRWFDGDCN